jgi:hypothetical protein
MRCESGNFLIRDFVQIAIGEGLKRFQPPNTGTEPLPFVPARTLETCLRPRLNPAINELFEWWNRLPLAKSHLALGQRHTVR